MQTTLADYAATGAGPGSGEGLVNVPLQIAAVRASAMFNESEGGKPVRISIRTKEGFDASAFAQRYGGGGHARAAGLRVDGPIAEVRARVVADLAAALDGATPPV